MKDTASRTTFVRELRKNSTDAERLLWRQLRGKQLKGYKFRRQEQIGAFVVDFICYEKKLIIEADGGQHALNVEKDEMRTAWFKEQGFTLLRFWNHEILQNIDVVMASISRAVDLSEE